jgi:hypothetical protein
MPLLLNRYGMLLVCLCLSLAGAPRPAEAQTSSLEFVGLMFPRGGTVARVQQGKFSGASLDVFVQVYKAGMTEKRGADRAIKCFLHWGRYGDPWTDVPMTYNKQIGNNDEYKARLTRAQVNALALGRHGFTAYCVNGDEKVRRWKQDSTNINSEAADDDVGDGQLLVSTPTDIAPAATGSVFVHLFEWRWNDIAKECAWLGQKGFWAVQVSPPMEHVPPRANMYNSAGNAYPWWVRYQPVTHDVSKFVSRSGTLDEFKAMIKACDAAGVGIIVDAVINHTTGVGSGTGTAGSTYTNYTYPQYSGDDFHRCGTSDGDIKSYQDREQIQTCELAGLADLKTGKPEVQQKLRGYLQSMLDLGVLGFRIDAAKHMSPDDVAAILSGLKRANGAAPFVFQEVIDPGNEPVKATEYLPYGNVTEFGFSRKVGALFNDCEGSLSDVRAITETMLPGAQAVVFTDNHDNQRGHGAGGKCILDHRDGAALYGLGNIFQLAFPYGTPALMSSYYWSASNVNDIGDSKGPPSATPPYTSGSGPETRPVYADGQAPGAKPINCSVGYEDGKWVCEHRRTAIANMVRFRAATVGEPVTDWQTIGGEKSDHIAFGRGAKGFVAINNTDQPSTATYQTSMQPGRYCDVTKYDYVNGACLTPGLNRSAPETAFVFIDATGNIVGKQLAARDAFAIHAGARMP